jgi:hypothetical protein
MANVSHSALTDPNLHEPKGVATAASGNIYVADGVGSGAWTYPIKKYTAALTPSAVAANTTAEQTFTVGGLVVATDTIIGVCKPTAQAGLGIVGWRVSANDTLAITFSNNTAAPILPTAGQIYTIFAHRP